MKLWIKKVYLIYVYRPNDLKYLKVSYRKDDYVALVSNGRMYIQVFINRLMKNELYH